MGNPSYQALPSEIFRNDVVSRVTQSSASLTAQDVDAPQLELNEHMAEEICSQGKKKMKTGITGKMAQIRQPL